MPDAELTDETYPLSATPLGIRHLLLWTACSAVLLSVSLALNRIVEQRQGVSLEVETFIGCVGAITDGPAVAGFLIWLACLRRGVRFPIQPGEWLLVLGGTSALMILLTMAVWCRLPLEQANQILSIPAGLMAGGYLIAAIWPPMPKWWRFALLAMAGLWGVEFVQNLILSEFFDNPLAPLFDLIGPLYFVALIVSIAIVIACVSIDRARHLQRGWMHWTGVASCIAMLLLAIGRHAYHHWLRG
jgi:hypothetical protein